MPTKKRKFSKVKSVDVLDSSGSTPLPSTPSSPILNASSTTDDIRKPYIFVLTGVRETAHCCSLGTQSNDQQFKTISNALNGGALTILDSARDRAWVCYVDDEACLKPELTQNESLAYLLGHMSGFLGLIYGPGVIVFEEPYNVVALFEATKNWFQSYKNGDFDYDVDLAVEKSSFSQTLSKIR